MADAYDDAGENYRTAKDANSAAIRAHEAFIAAEKARLASYGAVEVSVVPFNDARLPGQQVFGLEDVIPK